jgi:PAS domain S-box-containing protein
MTGRGGPRDRWERDERYEQLVELAPDGILVHDGERIVLANAAAVQLAGAASRNELAGLPIDAILHPPYLKSVQLHLTNGGGPAGTAPPVRDTLHRLDGAEVEVEVRAVAFVDHGRLSAHLIIRDITERLAAEDTARQLDERVQQAQRLETVGALAGGVAHEVNNMMGVVVGIGDFLLQDERIPEDCLADVRKIVQAAERAAAVSRQLLSFSRRAPHQPRVVDLGDVVLGTEPVVRRLLGEERRLTIEACAVLPVWIDPTQLEQVILNLALNARDAMAAGGVLTITVAKQQLPRGTAAADGAVIPAGAYATLVVRDTGIGMDAATRARIFEPFFTTKAIGHGTGLGLPAVEGVIRQHNGFVTVESEPWVGTAFTLYLPISSDSPMSEDPGVPPSPRADPAPMGATVLVVDDEPGVRDIVARSLKRGGFRPMEAANGGEALALVEREGPPELVVTDLMMPGIGGVELARQLRARWPALPIIFMSGYSAETLDLRNLAGVEVGVLEKPFAPHDLVAKVTAALSRT